MYVPVLDVAPFHHGTEQEQAQLATRITQELRKNGAVRLINHKIPAHMISQCYGWSEKFFRLPLMKREAILNERNADPQREWSYVGSEKKSKLGMVNQDGQVSQGLEDEKEYFDFCIAEDAQVPSKWPSESSIPGFRNFMESFLDTCHTAGMDIMQILEKGLELPEGELVNRFTTRVDEVRLNHYSPLSTEKLSDGKHQRAWPHTDFGMLTLLFQDEAGGLEVEDRSDTGSFIPIHRESPTEMSVCVSDTLEHMTNKHLRACIHQVVTPIGINDRANGVLPETYSIACFLKADRETNVGPLQKYITKETPRYYEDMTALELYRKRVGQQFSTGAVENDRKHDDLSKWDLWL